MMSTPSPVETKPPRRLRRHIVPLTLLVLGFLLTFAIPYPVVINSPGPTFNVLGKNQSGVPLIEVKDAKTYTDNNPKLMMTTVSTWGGPGSFVNGIGVLRAALDPNSVILSQSEVYPPSVTSQDIQKIGSSQMDQSQLAAETVALRHLGYQVPIQLLVSEVYNNPSAQDLLKTDDVLLRIATPGKTALEINDITSLRDYLSEVPAQTKVQLTIQRKGKEQNLEVKTVKAAQGKGSQLGVMLYPKAEIPLKIRFHLQDVGGPSAGTMFALGIVEELTPENIAPSQAVAGTGTIDFSGKVGAISGIAQKMAGARADGAQVFLAPKSNCDEVRGHVPDQLRVFAIDTFDQALEVLETLKQGNQAQIDKLPSCSASAPSK